MLQMIRLLVKHGADLGRPLTPSKETVLHVAIRYGLASAVRVLVPIVPDPMAAAEEGHSVVSVQSSQLFSYSVIQ